MRIRPLFPRIFFMAFIFICSNAAGVPQDRPLLARYLANKQAQRANLNRQKAIRKEIEEAFQQIRQLRLAKKADKEQSACDTCEELAAEFCNRPALYPEHCKNNSCHVELEPKQDICYRIYLNQSCYKTLTASARSRVNGCWRVDNNLSAKEIEIEIDNLEAKLNELAQSQLNLRKLELALEEKCPACSNERVPALSTRSEDDEP